jgi:AcrR family transcriptional regulator
MTEFGKRELNKARTRLDILNAVYSLSNAVAFRDLKVKSIAEAINITEMTFFNYFQKKEDILKYMMGLWALDLMVLQHQNPLAGEAAIRRIFQRTAEHVKEHPGLMVSFISYLVTTEIDPTANDIETADRYLLYPDFPELIDSKILSGNELLMQHLLEINPSLDHTQTLLHLASCFYGDVLVAHTADLDLDMLYSSSLDLILRNM